MSQNVRNIFLFPYLIELAVPMLMIVTGFNYYNSINKRTISGWLEKNIIRLLIPYFFVAFFQLIINSFSFGLVISIKLLFFGGVGPGSYYTVIMFQIIFLFPLMYLLVSKRYGILILIIINFLFEIIVSFDLINSNLYRLCSLRYFCFIAVGVLIAKYDLINKKISLKIYLELGITGLVCIWYLQSGLPMFGLFENWTVTSMPVVFLSVFFVLLAMKFIHNRNYFVELVSRASFHIFLFQMCWYAYVAPFVYHFVKNISILFIFVFTCMMGGILFYWVERKIKQHIRILNKK